jgi:hypothetical protein
LRQRQIIAVTELGEAHITTSLLLDIFADVILQGLSTDDYDGPTCTYVCACMNLLGKLGWLEARPKDKPPKGSEKLDTSLPPNFFPDSFRENKGGADDSNLQ